MTSPISSHKTEKQLLVVLLVFSLLLVSYRVLRFAGSWSGGDTVRMAAATYNIYDQGTLLPRGVIYEHGFNLQVVSTFLLNLTGLNLAVLVQAALPFLLVVNILVAYVAFRALTEDRWAGLLAAFFLVLQPEFLFTATRGTHEKLTWMLTLLALFILARSFTSLKNLSRFVVWMGLFYLVAFAIIASNTFFASSFLVALTVCFLTASVVSLVKKTNPFSRLVLVTVSCTILVFVFIFYLYTPATGVLYDLKPTIDKLATLLLGVDVPFSPGAAAGGVGTGWTSSAIYLALSLMSYLLALISFAYWLVLARRLLKGRLLGSPLFLLWLFYAAFAFQMALSVGASGLGLLASNLQVRLFPVFMLVVMPLAALGIREGVRRFNLRRLRPAWVLLVLLVFAWAAGSAMLKSTNEPLFSNHWIFRLKTESASLDYVQDFTGYGNVWLGLDRLRYADRELKDPLSRRYDIYAVDDYVRYALVSRFEQTRMLRVGLEQPSLGRENRVYDNGEVYLYHFRPRTPYQR